MYTVCVTMHNRLLGKPADITIFTSSAGFFLLILCYLIISLQSTLCFVVFGLVSNFKLTSYQVKGSTETHKHTVCLCGGRLCEHPGTKGPLTSRDEPLVTDWLPLRDGPSLMSAHPTQHDIYAVYWKIHDSI